jgi:hypothetical protein
VGNISCKNATFVSEGFQTVPRSTLTVTPTYDDCTFLGLETTVNMNGCAYLFTTPTEGAVAGTFHGGVNVECPEGKVITFAAAGCEVQVAPQTGLDTVEYTNLENGTVDVTSDVDGITYTAKGLCNTTPGLHHDGEYTGTAIASAENEAEESVSAFLE